MPTTASTNAVRRVIRDMRADTGREWTVDEMAAAAMFSKFHFTRLFRDVTGLSPGRFLSALRLQEAKRLLRTTGFGVADISAQVGYSSVGTFSTRFKECVGLSPREFRAAGGFVPFTDGGTASFSPARHSTVRSSVRHVDSRHPAAKNSVLHGRVLLPAPDATEAFGPCRVGLFPTPTHQGLPVRQVVLDRPGPFSIAEVPVGTWYVLADSLPGAERRTSVADDDAPAYVGSYGPVTTGGIALLPADVALRPFGELDPPVLTALPDPHTYGRGGHGAHAAVRVALPWAN
ncbi:helix-turn-helix transcriptional regulator [Streptomyces sp. NBC_00237]|uniref:helix-turn-helix transcriptional regulator n=1 Tax=Streptomyces sp. NBC_00237 TaxID=2975687 RepID=UPI0022524C81|nr:helix-turn-helix transcriptional regulator [Streptomyces sp. NBC_00237]MCX5205046.1 helix-turn-helix transcriptional regulator [Streptomyces sp. NBC_00237]